MNLKNLGGRNRKRKMGDRDRMTGQDTQRFLVFQRPKYMSPWDCLQTVLHPTEAQTQGAFSLLHCLEFLKCKVMYLFKILHSDISL